jgi:hypothetical protein
MLVDTPQDHRYLGGVKCYLYMGTIDGPADGGQYYHGYTIEDVMEEFLSEHGLPLEAWVQIPEQRPDCEEDWIAPVRRTVDAQQDLSRWEKLVEGHWIPCVPTLIPEAS